MSYTQAQLFQKFKAESEARRIGNWRDCWRQLCKSNLEMYYGLGWHVIPIAKHRKAPLRGEPWAEKSYRLEKDVALSMLCDGFNLGVVAGLSGLVMLDHDSDLPDELLSLAKMTMTEKTPRGYCIFLSDPFDVSLWKLFRGKFPTFDLPRVEIMYALVPPSRTCIRDYRGMDDCTRHDLRVRGWISEVSKPMPFKEFAVKALG